MIRAKSITLNLNESEMLRLIQLAKTEATTKTAILRRALNWYNDMQKTANQGDWRLETRIVDKDGNEVKKVGYIE